MDVNACSAVRWDQYVSTPTNPNYMGGLYVFNRNESTGDFGLGVVGFTGVGGFDNLRFLAGQKGAGTGARSDPLCTIQ